MMISDLKVYLTQCTQGFLTMKFYFFVREGVSTKQRNRDIAE